MLRSWTIGRDHNNWNNKAHSFWLKLRAEGENKKLFSELYYVSRPKLFNAGERRCSAGSRYGGYASRIPHIYPVKAIRSLPSFNEVIENERMNENG